MFGKVKYFDFKQATVFMAHCLSKQKTTRYARNLGSMAPLAIPGYAYG